MDRRLAEVPAIGPDEDPRVYRSVRVITWIACIVLVLLTLFLVVVPPSLLDQAVIHWAAAFAEALTPSIERNIWFFNNTELWLGVRYGAAVGLSVLVIAAACGATILTVVGYRVWRLPLPDANKIKAFWINVLIISIVAAFLLLVEYEPKYPQNRVANAHLFASRWALVVNFFFFLGALGMLSNMICFAARHAGIKRRDRL